MKNYFSSQLVALWLALFAVATFTPAWAQSETPAPAPQTAPTESTAPAAPDKSVTPETPAAPATPETTAAPEAPIAPDASVPPTAETTEVEPAQGEKISELRELGATPAEEPTVVKKTTKRSKNSSHDAPPFGNHKVSAGTTRQEVVSIMGSSTVDGEVTGDAVSIMGNTTVNGSARSAVSVMGTTTINGTVENEVVAVMGNVILGPKAVVHDVVVVMGQLERAEGAQVLGDVQEISAFGHFGQMGDFGGLQAWITKCLMWGRPLWIGEGLGWIWVLVAGFTIFYMLLALIFPKGVVRSAEALEQRPGATLLAALLSVVMVPVAFVLLAITGVGIVLIPFLVAALFFASLFGMASVLAWFGRRVAGNELHPVLAVLIGSFIVSLLYMIPVLGFVLWKLFGILGVGMVVQALILASKRDKPADPSGRPTVSPATPVRAFTPLSATPPHATPMQSAGFAAAASTATATGETVPPAEPVSEPVPPVYSTFTPPPPAPAFAATPTSNWSTPVLPVISASTLPRVGFWLRLGAATIDAVLMGMLCGFLSTMWGGFGVFPFWYGVYCAAMWATKGTTIGGIICGLKVVRLDDRPIDWSVAIVRTLGGYLSLFVAGLGFIWVAFDDEKQAWHDKIAGTTIVRVPKGTSLL